MLAKTDDRVFSPMLDILEKGDVYVVGADVPGATPDGLEVNIEHDMLRIRAKVTPPDTEGLPLLYREYTVGDFETVLRVSDLVNRDKITAELKDGGLTITLPKAEEVKPKQISVKAA